MTASSAERAVARRDRRAATSRRRPFARRDAARHARDVRRGDGAVLRAGARSSRCAAKARACGTRTGRMYIDFASGVAVTSLGHCHPAMVRALDEQARTLWHVSNWFTNEPALRLAQRLVDAHVRRARVLLQLRRRGQRGRAEARAPLRARPLRAAQDRASSSTINAFHGRTLFTVTAGGQAKYAIGLRSQSGRHHAHSATTTSPRSKPSSPRTATRSAP